MSVLQLYTKMFRFAFVILRTNLSRGRPNPVEHSQNIPRKQSNHTKIRLSTAETFLLGKIYTYANSVD